MLANGYCDAQKSRGGIYGLPKRRRRKKAMETLRKTKDVTSQRKNSTLLRQRKKGSCGASCAESNRNTAKIHSRFPYPADAAKNE